MTPFTVLAQPNFERMAQSLRKQHRDFDGNFTRALEIVKSDPHNVSRSYPIRKLTDVKLGDGQYRLRLEHFDNYCRP